MCSPIFCHQPNYPRRGKVIERICNAIIEWGLVAIVIFTPLARGTVEVWSCSLVYFITLIMLVAWVLKTGSESRLTFTGTPLNYPIFAFLGICVISTVFSIYRWESIRELYKIITYIAIYFILVNNFKTREKVKRIATIFIAMGIVISILGFVQYLAGTKNTFLEGGKSLSIIYVNKNHLAGYLEMAIPLSLGMMLTRIDRGKKIILGYGVVLMIVALVMTLSRGGWIGFSVSLALALFLLAKKGYYSKTFISFSIFGLIIVSILAVIGATSIINRISQTEEAVNKPISYNFRVKLWLGSLEIIKENPFLGTGLGTFGSAFPKYRPRNTDQLNIWTHNDYLQAISEMGIFILPIILWIIFVTLKSGFMTFLKTRSKFKEGVAFGATCGISAILIHSLVDFNLHIMANALFFTILTGMLMVPFEPKKQKKNRKKADPFLNNSPVNTSRPQDG